MRFTQSLYVNPYMNRGDSMNNIVENFVVAAKKQDTRNMFMPTITSIACDAIRPLYDKWQPTDVEIVFNNLTSIRFYPASKFDALLSEYNFSKLGITIFASWEGDPIYVENEHIYIAIHGCETYSIDKEFSSIYTFLDWIMQNMKQNDPC